MAPMQSQFLTTRIETQADYFSGASHRDFTKHLSPLIQIEPLLDPGWHTGSGIDSEVAWLPNGGMAFFLSGDEAWDTDHYTRAVAHTLVNLCPREGLQELVDSLRDIIAFYVTAPAIEQEPLTRLGSPVAVRDGGISVRPTVPLDDNAD